MGVGFVVYVFNWWVAENENHSQLRWILTPHYRTYVWRYPLIEHYLYIMLDYLRSNICLIIITKHMYKWECISILIENDYQCAKNLKIYSIKSYWITLKQLNNTTLSHTTSHLIIYHIMQYYIPFTTLTLTT